MAYPNRHGIPSSLVSEGPDRRIQTQSIDIRDFLTSRGFGFYVEWEEVAIPSNQKVYVEFTVSQNMWMALLFRELVTNKERLFYRVYTDYSAVTLGEQLVFRNLKNPSSISTSATAYKCSTPATINLSSRVTNVPVFGETNAGNRASGDVNTDAAFRLLGPQLKFLLELDNQSSSAIYAKLDLGFIEITPNLIVDGLFL